MVDTCNFTLVNSTILFIDVIGIYFTSIAIKYLFLYVALIVLIATILKIELKKLNKRFQHSIKPKNRFSKTLVTQLRKLEQFRFEHICWLAYLRPFNSHLVSPFCFAYIFGNVAFNAYNIVYLMYFEVQTFVKAFCLASLFSQIFLSFTCVYYLINLNLSIRLSVGTFELVLFRLLHKQKFLVSYWKSFVYYEFLKSKHIKYYSMTAGSLGCINRESLLQV